MIHFIIGGGLILLNICTTFYVIYLTNCISKLEHNVNNISSAIDLQPSYDGSESGYLIRQTRQINSIQDRLDNHKQGIITLQKKLYTLEDYLHLEYKSECTEKLPKYIKKSK